MQPLDYRRHNTSIVLIPLFDLIPPSKPASLCGMDRPLLREYCELAKGLNHEENGVSFVRSYPAWFGLNSKGVKLRAYKEVDGTLLLHLPGWGESTISNADGLRQLSPSHLGHGHLSIFLGRHTSHNFQQLNPNQKMWALIAHAIVYQFSGIASSGPILTFNSLRGSMVWPLKQCYFVIQGEIWISVRRKNTW